MFGFGKPKIPKCAQCGMELGSEFYEWQDKKFCCQDCKRAYRVGSKKGGSGGRCH